MSGYRSYVPWNKNSTSSSSTTSYSSAKKEANTPTTKYESPYSKSRPDAKKSEDKSPAGSTLGCKYTSSYSTGYQREGSASRATDSQRGSDLTTRIKSPTGIEKKESHPPITYRPITRSTGTRSRDPSPVDRERTDSSSSSYNYNRLYTRPYTRSVSKEKIDSSPSSTIPKYTGRSSLTKDDYKYPLGRTSRNTSREDLSLAKYRPPDTKEDILAARFKSKEDLGSKFKIKEDTVSSRYKSKEDLTPSKYKSKEELPSSRFKTGLTGSTRTPSREDLTKTPQKYISSRFLPKNTIEKSHTAYLRPSSRTSEVSRKNRELLNVLSTQHDDRSRPVSRCSSVTPEEIMHKEIPKHIPEPAKGPEMETITMVSRSTSPNISQQQPGYLRTRRVDVSRTVEKQVNRLKNRGEMVDKEIQSDRLDDSTKSSRFAGASRLAATPWSSYLDLKYSSPTESKKSDSSISETSVYPQSDKISNTAPKGNDSITSSSKNLSRNGSIKSLSRSSSKSDVRVKDSKSRSSSANSLSSGEKPKSKLSPPKSTNETKKQLPPQIPKADSASKVPTIHSLNTPNKDFRKSVLNMNPDGNKLKKQPHRSHSVSSAESESSINVENKDVSENKPKIGSVCKLPQINKPEFIERSDRRSPSSSSDSSSSSSSTDDEARIKGNKSAGSSRTSVLVSSGDDLSQDKCLKPPLSPRIRSDKEGDAKSFLMRALAPVTNFFKVKPHDATEGSSANTDKNISDLPKERVPKQRKVIKKIAGDDRSQWIEDLSSSKSSKSKLKLLRNVQSGEQAWLLDETGDAAQVVQVASVLPDKEKYKLKRNDSEDKSWWLDSSENTDKNISDIPKSESEEEKIRIISRLDSNEKSWWIEEKQESSKSSGDKGNVKLLRHVESGERAWWLDEKADIPEGVEVIPVVSTSEEGKCQYGKLVYKVRRNNSDNESWWLDSSKSDSIQEPDFLQKYKIRHIDSGERAWWLSSTDNLSETQDDNNSNTDWWAAIHSKHSDDEFDDEPLGARASPEGLETPREQEEGRLSPYDNVPSISKIHKNHPVLFISKHTNIDDILGGSCQLLSPLMDRIFSYQGNKEDSLKVDCSVNMVASSTNNGRATSSKPCSHSSFNKLDDAALQLYKDGDYGSYLDLDASISEQQEEFEGFHSNKKNSIVLRTKLSVRVHAIIEKLLTSEGRELRRALFSLKQIFQEDKDLVHEFVQNDGLACLIKVGSEADQNYQNYILRALGQVMLYVDGMNGVMEHNQTVQWLYTLISSKFRLVVKTALKLLLVFVEYIDSNCMLLIKAIHTIDSNQGLSPWNNIMKLLKDFDSADTELLIYATTLINKCLNGIPDQDTYYDQTDALEEQGIESIIQRYMSKQGTDLDLLQQFQIYEAVLQYEDGEEKGTPIRHLDETIRKTLRSRKSLLDSAERRKSRRHSTGTTPVHNNLNNNGRKSTILQASNEDDDESSSSQSTNGHSKFNGGYKESSKAVDAGVTPALRRRRERAERQRSFMKEQQENATLLRGVITNNENENNENDNFTNGIQQRLSNGNNVLNRSSCKKDLTPYMNAVNKLDSDENGLTKLTRIMYNNDQNQENVDDTENGNENDRKMLLKLMKENTVKDLTQKLASQNILHSPSSDENKVNRIEGMTGLINKAKEGLAKSKSQANVLKSPTGENISKLIEIKKSENELRWEELVLNMNRPLNLCDMDFTDLDGDDENDILTPVQVSNGIPPPPPPISLCTAPPPPPRVCIPPPVPAPPIFGINLQKQSKPAETKIPIKKNKKTVKLFWKEVRDDPINTVKLKTGYIWDELNAVSIDTQKLEHLFESRAKDLINKKQQELNKNKEIIVLDPKRSNAINIGMTKLPPPRSIKTAILKMDATIMNREGIEKLLTMLPTEEERTKIQEAQTANPELPLGSAEQFLLTLASISELPARLKLWAFKLDFENTEREIAEPLMDLKQGFEVLKMNRTFRGILSTLLSIGNFLNGNEVKGFQIEYLTKVPEVKDTVHKHSLLHHLCHIVMEKFPDATDLYSEIGAITRASKVDFDELSLNIQRLESDCKASWDHLKLIAKHDGSTMKSKMSDFLADCAERIILLAIIHRRVMNRFHKFLLWLGIPVHQVTDTKPNEFCRIVSEFALEYRTTRERVLQQLEKKANHRERNKTRGKMITETAKFRTKEDRADAELRQLLGSDMSDVESLQGTLPWRRTRRDANKALMGTLNGHLTDGDDEILESLVKTATKAPSSRTAPRERKRTRHADRKSLRRTLKNGLSEEEKKHLSAYIKGY